MILFLLVACAQPLHLQYDFGRTYWEAAATQTDLSRPSVAQSLYPLSGVEGAALRANAEKETADVKSGAAEVVK